MKRIVYFFILLALTGCSSMNETARHEAHPNQEYIVKDWLGDETYHSDTLYVVTKDAPGPVQEKIQAMKQQGDTDTSAVDSPEQVPIAIFVTDAEGETAKSSVGKRFLLLSTDSTGIANIYTLNQSDTDVHVGSSTAFANAFMSLAGKTSENTPLYVVSTGEAVYAVIGSTAYHISEWGFELAPEMLSKLYLGDGDCIVKKIDLKSKHS